MYGLLGVVDFLAATRAGWQVALAYEYLLSAVATAFFARRGLGRPGPGDLGPGHPGPAPAPGSRHAGGWPGREAVLLGMGLFLAVMALRLYVFGTTGQVWGKGPMLVLTLAVALGYQGWGWAGLGLSRRALGKQLALGFLACLWIWLLITAANLLAPILFAPGVAVGWTAPAVSWLAVTGLSLRFLGGNFAEELFFRGYLLRAWEKALGPTGSLLAQALLFGLFHVNYHLFPPDPRGLLSYVFFAGSFGVAMGVITQRAGTLLPAALAHPFYNLTIACGLASLRITWQGAPRVPVALVGASATLIQLGLFWVLLPRLMDWSARILAATPPAAGIPCRPSGVRSPRAGPPRGVSPTGR